MIAAIWPPMRSFQFFIPACHFPGPEVCPGPEPLKEKLSPDLQLAGCPRLPGFRSFLSCPWSIEVYLYRTLPTFGNVLNTVSWDFFFYLLFWQTGALNWDEINCACKWPIKSVYVEAAYPPVSTPFNNQVTFLFQIILH